MLTPLEIEAVSLSLWVASWSTLTVLPLAIVAALILARAEFWGKSLFDGIIHLPLVLPPVVIGYLLLITLGTRGVIGSWLLENFGIRLIFTSAGASVAAGVMSFPLMVRAIRLAIEAIDSGLEAAARTLGAGPIDRFLTITLPLMLPGILSGAVMAFAASLGEFGATITFVSNIPGETRTLPLAIYTATQTPDGDLEAARLVALSFTLSLSALILSEWLGRRVRRMMGRP
ncbi:molybdate transport system permease protein [Skermanella aerolata]|uniref:Molybdenum transport system permease n=1 Tax=Skermanella aerolata TaxID=393310 RepID=A0A512DV56_9PROT|nr:molybdate ABC transporter permease subunit [Skermanella aerolata]GEO40354.1 molybdate ABC transporter permease [Skermanella aerolata]